MGINFNWKLYCFVTQPLQVRSTIKETIPTLSDFLKIATMHKKSVIFDITEPQSADHPYKEDFIKLITDAIKTSKITEEKVVPPCKVSQYLYEQRSLIVCILYGCNPL